MSEAALHESLPPARREDAARANRLAWWSIAWLGSIIVLMGMVMQSSQAMKTAWIEDILSLIPPIVLLVAARMGRKPPNRRYPLGYERVNSLAFLVAAVALTAMGAFLIYEAVVTLIRQERVTIGLIRIFGQDIWAGWLMIAVLAYSIVPPVLLGHMKLPLARNLQDKVLHTDAMMNKADWMTGLAGIAGVVGLGFGLWWADAAAAGAISVSILKDGVGAIRIASAELVDGAPRCLDKDEIAADAVALETALSARYPGARVQLRETGRYIRAVVSGHAPPDAVDPRDVWPGDKDRAWRLAQLSFEQKDDGRAE